MSLVRAGLVVASLVALTAVVACSSDKDLTSPDAGPTPYCPATVDKAAGAACTGDVNCDYHYTCGSFFQQVTCDCKGGKFSCIDATGAELAQGTTPTCAPVNTPSPTCPASVAAADGKSCTSLGSACNYPGVTCKDGFQRLNVCLCRQSTGDAGWVWDCEIPICPQ
jgi:hypothetical protein